METRLSSIWRAAIAMVLVLSVALATLVSGTSPALAATAPPLGTAGSFAVLAGTTVTNTGATAIIGGDVGVSPGSAITNFPPGTVTGGILRSNDAVTIAAQSALTNAYTIAAGQPFTSDLSGSDLGSLAPLVPGVYRFSSSAQLTGTLTLNGGPADVWIFQIGSTLTTASNSNVVITGGGLNCNVFWQVGSSATLGTSSAMVGNILALTTITMNTGASLAGRALARNGAVNLDTSPITVCSLCTPFTFSPAPAILPAGIVGNAYSQAIAVTSGGVGPFTYTIILGSLPPGAPAVTLSAGGLLSGTPTTPGSYTFTVQATDTGVTPNCLGSHIYTIVVNPAGCISIPLVAPTSLPVASGGAPYSQLITASGGTAPYTFSVSFGSPPPGLVLNPNGLLSGIPLTSGSFTFTVTATDSNALHCAGVQIYSVLVSCPTIAISSNTFSNGTVGIDYSRVITVRGGSAPYTFALIGALPTGVKLYGGRLSGTPTTIGTYNFAIRTIDAGGCLASQSFSVVIASNNPTGTISHGSGQMSTPNTSSPGVSISSTPPTQLSNFAVTSACVEKQGKSDKITLCLKNTTANPQTIVARLLANNADAGQKSFVLPPNAEICDSWVVDTQASVNYRVNVGGVVEQDVPLCRGGANSPTANASSDAWIYLLIALVVIVIVVVMYFIIRKRPA
jgi:hypothetical protein